MTLDLARTLFIACVFLGAKIDQKQLRQLMIQNQKGRTAENPIIIEDDSDDDDEEEEVIFKPPPQIRRYK